MGKSMTNSAAQAATGMTTEENEKLILKCRTGTMNFNDFMSMLDTMNKLGGAGSALGTVGNMLSQGNQDMEEAKLKMKNYQAILDAMTPEERENPGPFLAKGKEIRPSIERIAKDSNNEEEAIDTFILEFGTLRSLFGKLGAGDGRDFEDIAKEVRMENAVQDAEAKSRPARRALQLEQKKGDKKDKKKGKTPEWMTA
ncbi:unnamed protein product [Polarella glacialis]|uniref:Signal recognition particle SRP54 subunit M-domain domain-containing protein n=1 Tax=Polarella glacialis TaxID=89957 RepID=A0A813FIS9_POLGL|nr:unnamed protein product [Polarella glacialis]